jgi:RNase P subunit RPR2
VKVKRSKCSNCGLLLDAASAVKEGVMSHDVKPKPGDITVCIRCGHIMAFNRQLKLVELSLEQALAVAGDKDILRIQRARRKLEEETIWEKIAKSERSKTRRT